MYIYVTETPDMSCHILNITKKKSYRVSLCDENSTKTHISQILSGGGKAGKVGKKIECV